MSTMGTAVITRKSAECIEIDTVWYSFKQWEAKKKRSKIFQSETVTQRLGDKVVRRIRRQTDRKNRKGKKPQSWTKHSLVSYTLTVVWFAWLKIARQFTPELLLLYSKSPNMIRSTVAREISKNSPYICLVKHTTRHTKYEQLTTKNGMLQKLTRADAVCIVVLLLQRHFQIDVYQSSAH